MPRSPRSTQRPPGGTFVLVDVLAVEGEDAAAQHRHLDRACRPAPSALTRLRKPSTSLPWMSTKKKFGARSAMRAGQFAAQIAVDQRQRDQQRQAEAERQHDRGGQRAGAVDIADRQPQRRRVDARAAPRQAGDAGGDQPQDDEGDGDGAEEDHGDEAVIGGNDGKAGERRQNDGGQRAR